ncbi:MAG TPA: hypothetical protein VFX65_04880 [Candidatus Limnocylindrales bacterium]|nr:hypothetical protein [Candidatus Limnocylindrales bacterium]
MKEIEVALAAWRLAERELAVDDGRTLDELVAAVHVARSAYQQLAGDHMAERIGALKDAETRRQAATPSTPAYHTAAGEETDIAGEIWSDARVLDEDTPRSPAGRG